MGPLSPWIMWSIWVSRNKLVFNDKFVTTEEAFTSAISSAKEWLEAQHTSPVSNRRKVLYECRNNEGLFVCQSDAAWKEDMNAAGLGCVVLSNGSRIMDNINSTLHVCSPLMAEGLALREAMYFAQEKGLKKLRFESDSSQLINAINSGLSLLNLYGIIEDIKAIAQTFELVSFVCIPRESNVFADMLAKQAIGVLLALSG